MATLPRRGWWRGLGPLLWGLGLLLVGLAVGIVVLTDVLGTTESGAPSLEEQAVALDKSLICPVCPGETIDQSQADLAQQMRVLVRKKLAENETPGEIRQYFVDRYGPMVLAEPPKKGFNLVIWVVPPLMLLAGAGVLFLVVRELRRGIQRLGEDGSLSEVELEPYLSLVDEQLAETSSIPPSNPVPPADAGQASRRDRAREGQGS